MILFLHFFLVLVSIEKIDQTLKTMFDHISKQLEVYQNTLLQVIFCLVVWKCSQT